MEQLWSREELAGYVDEELTRMYTAYRREATRIDNSYAQLIEDMHDFIQRGGKRIRAYLTYLGYVGFGGEHPDKIIRVAASQELLHNFLLIHDDIIDRDTMRYHGSNLQGIYQQQVADSEIDAQHYGQSVALLAGDINHILMYQLLLDSGFPGAEVMEALQWVNTKTLEVAGGEFLDLMLTVPSGHRPTQRQLLSVARYKTASYSFECPLGLGAVLAGADSQSCGEISEFAVALGIAYQLQDDMLGIFGESEATGKPITSDLEEGKQTLLMHYGLTAANPQQARLLKDSLNDPAVDNARLRAVQDVLIGTGAKDRVQQEAEEYVANARALLPRSLNESARTALENLTHHTVQRTF